MHFRVSTKIKVSCLSNALIFRNRNLVMTPYNIKLIVKQVMHTVMLLLDEVEGFHVDINVSLW